jgi:hypothetical protein
MGWEGTFVDGSLLRGHQDSHLILLTRPPRMQDSNYQHVDIKPFTLYDASRAFTAIWLKIVPSTKTVKMRVIALNRLANNTYASQAVLTPELTAEQQDELGQYIDDSDGAQENPESDDEDDDDTKKLPLWKEPLPPKVCTRYKSAKHPDRSGH